MSIDVDKTKAAIAVLNVLQQNGYIRGYRFNIKKPRKTETLLKYKNQEPAPVRGYCVYPAARYVRAAVLSAQVHAGFRRKPAIAIVSTSKGVVSNSTAHKLNVGGELICSVF